MKEKTSALNSMYIIDGVARQFTPAEILDGCLGQDIVPKAAEAGSFEPIVDETKDPSPSANEFHVRAIQSYLSKVSSLMGTPRNCPISFPESFTKSRIAKALLDTLWMKGHFRLSDLALIAKWRWNGKPLGSMASFYSSVEAAADYINELGISLNAYSFNESEKFCQASFKVAASDRITEEDMDIDPDEEFDLPGNTPFGSDHPVLGRRRMVQDKLVPDPESWIIYVPFDSCEFRLGNSLLCDTLGQNGDTFPEVGDADYFIDCFEVLREFVEDHVVISAGSVADGGLLPALKSMCREDVGATLDVSGIMSAYGEDNSIRVLFSEIPGALIQIKDIDYDYVDAEFLLQDIAYYPVGHPVPGSGKVKVKTGRGNGISEILQSLLNSQTSEGED